MTKVEKTLTLPFTVTEFGTIRIGDSRVSLDSVIHHYKQGESVEGIFDSFPSLSLPDIYLTIAYYLTHREEVEEYLRQQEAEAEAIRQQMESDPQYQKWRSELRERLLARWAARQESLSTTHTE
jgi:uncharacterized protein (DUF433 family)